MEVERLRTINTMTTEVCSPTEMEIRQTMMQQDQGMTPTPPGNESTLVAPSENLPFLEYMKEVAHIHELLDHRCDAALDWIIANRENPLFTGDSTLSCKLKEVLSGWDKANANRDEIERSQSQLEHIKNAKSLKLKSLGEADVTQRQKLDEWESSKTNAMQIHISETTAELDSSAKSAQGALEDLVKYMHALDSQEDPQQSPEVGDLVKELDSLFADQAPDDDGLMASKEPHMIAVQHISALPDGKTKTALMALCEANMVTSHKDKCCFLRGDSVLGRLRRHRKIWSTPAVCLLLPRKNLTLPFLVVEFHGATKQSFRLTTPWRY